MSKVAALAVGTLVAAALTLAPTSPAFAGGGYYGHAGYGYRAWPVVGLAAAVVGTVAAIVAAPIVALAAAANAPYYGPPQGYGPLPDYAQPPVAYGAPVAPAYYYGPPVAPAYYAPPAATVYYAPRVAAVYYGPPARAAYYRPGVSARYGVAPPLPRRYASYPAYRSARAVQFQYAR